MGKILAVVKNDRINCQESECLFRKECANHETAGEYRVEGGFSPELVVNTHMQVFCSTKDRNPIYEEFFTLPINHEELGIGEVRLTHFVQYEGWERYLDGSSASID